MHRDELGIDEGLARTLIGSQYPGWAGMTVRRIAVDGTVNAIFRIGDDLAARFPLRAADPDAVRASLNREAEAMRDLAVCCPFPTPAPVAIGDPGGTYPLPWSVQTWLPGDVASPHALETSAAFARDLSTLIGTLRTADTNGRSFGGGGRGGNLQDSDQWMDACFRQSEGLLPVGQLRLYWSRLRTLPAAGPDMMTHGDLIPGNLLVDGEHLVGVLDGGGFGPADPALDLVAAWHMLEEDGRAVLRHELGCSELEWQRGAAWAFQQAMGLVWYYRESLPGISALGRSTLTRILRDPEVAAFVTHRGPVR
ncbi:aminoglycoside phosphotransferase family protein [Leifsonia sp. 2MCAF36]|uniref:aminoglycoside phosphotransferase family protein n=1 Tax=Leifsonia sp. 2MCAF36 TaxID=3232988 RepID=UPI003F9D535F